MSPAQLDRYPNAPAGRGTETGRQAARDIRPRAQGLRGRVLAVLALVLDRPPFDYDYDDDDEDETLRLGWIRSRRRAQKWA